MSKCPTLLNSVSHRPASMRPTPRPGKHRLCALVIPGQADLGGLTCAAAVSWLGGLG